MILRNLTDRQNGPWRRVSMDLVWEDNSNPPMTVYFEAKGETAGLMQPRANGFAVACLPLAAWMGETRLRVEAPICIRLRSGLRFLNEIYCDWHRHCRMVSVEADEGFHPTTPPAARQVASLISTGVDALMALRQNRLDYPPNHPESIRACIFLYGVNNFDFDQDGPVPERLREFDTQLERLGELAREEHFTLLTVRTNIRRIAPDYKYWTQIGYGPAHSAVAQLFDGTFDKVLMASDGDGANPESGGMHPVINHHFSTDAVRIEEAQGEMTRPEKVALLTAWEFARRNMQPCHQIQLPADGRLNCGRCEKCVRTMLILAGLGKLPDVSAFTENDLTPSQVFLIPVHSKPKAEHLRRCIAPLIAAGRPDLAWTIRARLALFSVVRR